LITRSEYEVIASLTAQGRDPDPVVVLVTARHRRAVSR
jgi:hypothetical protein